MSGATRVLVCEDAPGYRMLLAINLADAGMHVVAEATSWDEAIAAAREHKPELLLVDLWLPTRDDDALRELCSVVPDARCVALTGLSVEEAEEQVGGLGVMTLILSKRQPMDELIAALMDHLGTPRA